MLLMTKYEKLIIKAEKMGAEVRELDFGTSKPCGRCLNNIIYVNNKVTEKAKYEVLAEEIGHYKTTYGNILNQNTIADKKQEFKARREGFKMIVEPIDIVESMKHGATDINEIADYIGISVETFFDILEDLKKRYGIGIPVGNYYIRLEPSFGIVKDFGGLLQY